MSVNKKPILSVRGLRAGYGKIEALHGIDIEVNPGELVALVGANGAGKTTLLRTISGVIKATGGVIDFNQSEITRVSPDKRVKAGICQVPEGRQVFSGLSVADNLKLGGYTRKASEYKNDLERIYELFPILLEKSDLPAGTLSGGQQQMLAMGRALMGSPKVLLLDEPSMGLAPLLIKEIFNVINKLKREGITILLVEQNAQAALSIAEKGYVLESGKIVASGSGSDLLQDDRVRQAYLGM